MPKLSNVSPKHPVAKALRNAGYLPLPRLWIKAEDMQKIHALANQYSVQVNTIRAEARGLTYFREDVKKEDPKTSKESAWEEYERLRSAG